MTTETANISSGSRVINEKALQSRENLYYNLPSIEIPADVFRPSFGSMFANKLWFLPDRKNSFLTTDLNLSPTEQ